MEKKNPLLSVVVLLVIVAAAVGTLFLMFKPADNVAKTDNTGLTNNTGTPAASPQETPVVTAIVSSSVIPSVTPSSIVTPTVTLPAGCPVVAPVTAAAVPGNWKPVDNSSQGYTAYRPTGFYFRMFPPDMFVLGIDPNPIPTASEYMGVINMMRLSASNNFDSYLANLEPGYTTCSREIDGRTWTTVVGKTKTTEAYAGQYVKYGKVTVNGKEFMARLSNPNSNYGGYSGQYETFITTLVFK